MGCRVLPSKRSSREWLDLDELDEDEDQVDDTEANGDVEAWVDGWAPIAPRHRPLARLGDVWRPPRD